MFYYWQLGLCDTQIMWTEDDMHKDTRLCADNYTTPRETVRLLEAAYANVWIRRVMEQCETGQHRIPALLLKDRLLIGHNTATGDTSPDGLLTGINDVGFVTLPNGDHYFIAVFCNNSALTMDETETLIADISRMADDNIRQTITK